MNLPESTWVRLKTQLDCVPVLLAGTAEAALERRPSPEKWSARENLAHLARYQNVFLERLNSIKTLDRPSLPGYRAEKDPEWESWIDRSAQELTENLAIKRMELIERVATLSKGDLERTASHSRFGEMTVVQWLEFFLLHEAHHLLVVFQRTRE